MIDLSIIIVSYKGWFRLTKCLESLDSFSGKNFSSEVIVIDNDSRDDTINQLEEKFSRFRFIHNKINGGFANGCNLGSKNASGQYFLFLNPDTVAKESEIEKLLNIARQNPSFGIVSCRQVNEQGKESISSGSFPHMFNLTGLQRSIFGRRQACFGKLSRRQAPDSYREGDRLKEEVEFPDWVSGSVIMIRKELFEKSDGFDEDFWMYFEDVDICRRIRNNNFEVVSCRDITVEHNHGGSSRINLETASLTKTEVHISRHVYISKHKRGLNKILIQIFLVINNLVNGIITATLGLILFFIPKAFVRTLIFMQLFRYYLRSIFRHTWVSPRSVKRI